MRAGNGVIFAQAAVGFGWILSCQQIVGDGDDREKNQDEDGQGNQLLAAASTAREPNGTTGETRSPARATRD